MAGVTGFLPRPAVVLVMRGGKPGGIVHVQAASVGSHYVTGETEAGPLGAVHVLFITESASENRKYEKGEKGQDLAAARHRDCGRDYDDGDHNDGDNQYRID